VIPSTIEEPLNMRSARGPVLAVAVAAVLSLAACGGGDAGDAVTQQAAAGGATTSPPADSPAPSASAPAATAPSGYVEYAKYAENPAMYSAGKVVLFFHATWCPDCQRTDKNLSADPASVPAGLTIVKVDYDSMTDLRRKYGVTRQWTFVSIDADGGRKNIWTGTETGAAIAAQA
jgi:thiol-disulfide isomerase/thioredoxin